MNNKLTKEAWHHIAITHQDRIMKFYRDGILQTTLSTSGYNFWDNGSAVMLGGATYGSSYCFFDEFRLSKGIVRWTENFTPPTKEY